MPTGGGPVQPSSRRRCRWARWPASSGGCSGSAAAACRCRGAGHHLRRQRHLGRAPARRPGRRHAVRDAPVRRARRRRLRRRLDAGRLRRVLLVRPDRGGRAGSRGFGVRVRGRHGVDRRARRGGAAGGAAAVAAPRGAAAAAREAGGRGLVAGVQKVSGKPEGDPEEIVAEQLDEVTALEPDRPTLWIAALLAALNWLADAACLAFAILAVGGDVPWEGLLLAWAAGRRWRRWG